MFPLTVSTDCILLTQMDFGQGRPLTVKVRVRSQVHVVFVVDKVEVAQVPLPVLRSTPVTVIPPKLRTHLHLDTTVEGQRAKLGNPRTKKCSFGTRGALDREVLSLYVSFRNTELMLGDRKIDANTKEWDATAPASHETVP